MGRHGFLNVHQLGIRWKIWGVRSPNSHLFDNLGILYEFTHVTNASSLTSKMDKELGTNARSIIKANAEISSILIG